MTRMASNRRRITNHVIESPAGQDGLARYRRLLPFPVWGERSKRGHLPWNDARWLSHRLERVQPLRLVGARVVRYPPVHREDGIVLVEEDEPGVVLEQLL